MWVTRNGKPTERQPVQVESNAPKETKMQKIAKKHCFGQFEVQMNLQRFLRYLSKITYLNNFQNTISHVKFPEEFESFIRIIIRVKALFKNC